MVWAACVAVYMSANRTIAIDRMPEDGAGLQTIVFGAWGVLGGTYLAGLLLFVLRRIRRQRFPRSGGEILWMMGGISVVQGLGTQLLITLTHSVHYWYAGFQFFFGLCVWLPVYVYAILRTRSYWRLLFIVFVIISVLWFFFQYTLNLLGLRAIYIGLSFRMVLVASAVVLVALLDLRCAPRYPWPHWVGILLDLFSRILWATFYLITLLTQEMPR